VSSVRVRRVETGPDLDAFIALPFRLHAGDPNWVPPIRAEVRNGLTPGRGPFWGHAERDLFLAERDGEVVGRIAAILDRNYNSVRQSRIGFFGYLETTDNQSVATALFDAATGFARDRNCARLLGPANPSINDESGLLVGPFDSPPMIRMSYNPPSYPRLVEACGCTKAKDLYAYIIDTATPVPDKLRRVMEKLKQKPGLAVRPIELNHVRHELNYIKEVYNDAWSRNWDFTPMTDEELDDLARQLKPLIEPSLCPFVFYKGEIAGMCIALPDYNVILRQLDGRLGPLQLLKFLTLRKKIDQCRLWALGLKRKFHNLGFDSLMYYESFMAARKLGYRRGEVSWILEDNIHIIRPIEMMGGRIYKTYRIYSRPVS
jgi:hypothetical protein